RAVRAASVRVAARRGRRRDGGGDRAGVDHRRRLRGAGGPPAPPRPDRTGADVTGYAAELAPLHANLRELGATVAVAESLTGGLLTAALTDTPGASATVRGGLVVYATSLKASLAGVPAQLLAERGAVDPDVAVALARGAR